jgi:rRNA maturation endonuclease Nob1
MSAEAVTDNRTLRHRGSSESSVPKPVRYGLPCAKCKAYYSAEFDACPICSHAERVAANGSAQAALSSSAGIF